MKSEIKKFKNPILTGFYPDPSICRVDEDYYLVTSSFAYFPGLPIFHSKDLVHFSQIGHGISKNNMIDYKECETSLGLWAPTIRYHEGIFYIINTFVSEGREAKRDNFIIRAKEPQGPWSSPIFIDGADGIDPSLFFDEDGSLWYTGNFIFENPLYEGHHGIYLSQLDPETFQFQGERRVIWDGATTHSKWIEAPHIYKKNGWYYLMVAEGGTFVNHSVMMARSRSITGPYEPCPRNPIITHRHLPLDHEISVVGHGDLIETQNGEWWMVLLGVRNYEQHHFNTGRETCLLPIRWMEDGWPMADSENGLVNSMERMPDLPAVSVYRESRCDQFERGQLSYMWNMIHEVREPFYSLTERAGWLSLSLKSEVIEKIGSPAFVGRRQEHASFMARTKMDFQPATIYEEAGICILQDHRFHYCLLKAKEEDGTDVLRLYQTKEGITSLYKKMPILRKGALYLTVICRTDAYDFYYGYTEGECILLQSDIKASLLSSYTNKGFTGVYIGMYATANGKSSISKAYFDWFLYETL